MGYKIANHSELGFDFAAILDFVANYAGYAVARSKIAEIRQTIARLKYYPHIGTGHPEIAPNLRAIPSAGRAVVCFTVDDDRRIVRIICVTYAGQDWQAIARNRREG